MTVALSLNNSNSIQQKNRWDTNIQFPKTPVSKSHKYVLTNCRRSWGRCSGHVP